MHGLRDPRIAKLGLAVAAVAYAALHVAALFTDGIHWDEFLQLWRAELAVDTGVLDGGGRPGLSVALVTPFVDGCTSTIDVVHQLRIVWCVFAFALLGAVFELVRRMHHGAPHAWHAAALATAALALHPLFERWSLQMRTDPAAVACALWGGVALLASRRRAWLAVLGGAGIGLGYLFSQKAIYITALVGLLAVGDLYIARTWSLRREAVRVACLIAGAVAVVALYHVIVGRVFSPPETVSLDRGFDLFRWYRSILKFRIYGNILSTLWPHLLLLALIAAAAVRSFRRDTPARRTLLVALATLVLAVAIGRFHAGSFPYFWITIGVFPAVAIGLGWPGIVELLPRAHVAVAAVAALLLVALGVRYRLETLEDHQAIQRASLAFVERNLDRSIRGFHPDGALVCRGDDQLRPLVGETIAARFGGKQGRTNLEQFVAEFRTRPIAFVVETARVMTYPPPLPQLLRAHYVPYAHNVWLAGRALAGPAGTRIDVEVIAPGRYRFVPGIPSTATIAVDGRELRANDTLDLAAGTRIVELRAAVTGGMLVLAVSDPPAPTSVPFHSQMTSYEMAGIRRRWWRD